MCHYMFETCQRSFEKCQLEFPILFEKMIGNQGIARKLILFMNIILELVDKQAGHVSTNSPGKSWTIPKTES